MNGPESQTEGAQDPASLLLLLLQVTGCAGAQVTCSSRTAKATATKTAVQRCRHVGSSCAFSVLAQHNRVLTNKQPKQHYT